MVRTQVQITEEQARELRRMAREEGISLSEAVRRCIDRMLERRSDRAARYRHAQQLVGAFPDPRGARDLARDHDAHLDDAFS
jgi:Arc/MetJ-type ribon-helix-helix transcriptional regulator